MLMSTKTLMTVEDYAAMNTPETEDYGLVEGQLIPVSSGDPIHADIRGRLEHLLRSYFERNPRGRVLSEVDCRLSVDTVRKPDVSIFLGDHASGMDRKKSPIPFAPDIAVQILKPSDKATDVHRKTLDYLAAGSHEVWQLDHENGEIFIQTNTGIRLLRGQDPLESPLLPGFSVTVAALLAGF